MRSTFLASAVAALVASTSASTPVANDYYNLVNKATGTLVTDNWSYYVTANNSDATPSSQVWYLSADSQGSYTMTNMLQNDGLAGVALGKQIQTLPQVGFGNQYWTVEKADPDGYKVLNIEKGGCLGLSGRNKTSGAEVVLDTWIGETYQVWYMKVVKESERVEL